MTKPFPLLLARRAFALLVGLLLVATAFAQMFPSKIVNMMVPYPTGGLSDAIARIVATPLSKQLGQQVIVENLGGVGGAPGGNLPIGNGEGEAACMVDHPGHDFNDHNLPIGAALWALLTERFPCCEPSAR